MIKFKKLVLLDIKYRLPAEEKAGEKMLDFFFYAKKAYSFKSMLFIAYHLSLTFFLLLQHSELNWGSNSKIQQHFMKEYSYLHIREFTLLF